MLHFFLCVTNWFRSCEWKPVKTIKETALFVVTCFVRVPQTKYFFLRWTHHCDKYTHWFRFFPFRQNRFRFFLKEKDTENFKCFPPPCSCPPLCFLLLLCWWEKRWKLLMVVPHTHHETKSQENVYNLVAQMGQMKACF